MKLEKWIYQGLFLGIVFFLAILIIKPIGVSTQFSVFSGIVHSTVNPNVIEKDESRKSGYKSTNAYYDKSEGSLAKNIKNPMNYDFIFVLFIPVGAYIGYIINKGRKEEKSHIITKTSNDNLEINKPKNGYILSFLGGFIILYGARMADGCTSGHMMSGMMQGAVSGYIFTIAVFIVAIPTAIFMKKRNA